jgi:hypothetical protein
MRGIWAECMEAVVARSKILAGLTICTKIRDADLKCIADEQSHVFNARIRLAAAPRLSSRSAILNQPHDARRRRSIILLVTAKTLLLSSEAVAQSQPPSLIVTPETAVVFDGPEGGPFQPSSFQYRLRASSDPVRYSIRTPSWLKASSSSGSVGTDGATVTFTLDTTAGRMQPGTYGPVIAFTNVTNGRGSAIRPARLHIQAPVTAGAPSAAAAPAPRVAPVPPASPAPHAAGAPRPSNAAPAPPSPPPRPTPSRNPPGRGEPLPDGTGGHLTDDQGNRLLAR